MSALNLFPARIRFVNTDGTLTDEALRMFAVLVERVGGVLGDAGADVFAVAEQVHSILQDVLQQAPPSDASAELVRQPAPSISQGDDVVMQLAPYLPGTAMKLIDYHFSLQDTTVTTGTYGDATHVAKFTVDQQGRLTSAASIPINFPSTAGANYSGSLTGKTVIIANGLITSVT